MGGAGKLRIGSECREKEVTGDEDGHQIWDI